MGNEPLILAIPTPLKEALAEAAKATGKPVVEFVLSKLAEAVPRDLAAATVDYIGRRTLLCPGLLHRNASHEA